MKYKTAMEKIKTLENVNNEQTKQLLINFIERKTVSQLPEDVSEIRDRAFYLWANLIITFIPKSVVKIGEYAFFGCTGITTLTFKGTPDTIESDAFYGCTNLTTINVPWAEGEVANAPWGATNATINYNYVET